MDKDLKKVIQALKDAGFQVTINRKGHPEVRTADGEWITTFSGTPSDWRSFRNSLAPLKRRGFKWPPGR